MSFSSVAQGDGVERLSTSDASAPVALAAQLISTCPPRSPRTVFSAHPSALGTRPRLLKGCAQSLLPFMCSSCLLPLHLRAAGLTALCTHEKAPPDDGEFTDVSLVRGQHIREAGPQ